MTNKVLQCLSYGLWTAYGLVRYWQDNPNTIDKRTLSQFIAWFGMDYGPARMVLDEAERVFVTGEVEDGDTLCGAVSECIKLWCACAELVEKHVPQLQTALTRERDDLAAVSEGTLVLGEQQLADTLDAATGDRFMTLGSKWENDWFTYRFRMKRKLEEIRL